MKRRFKKSLALFTAVIILCSVSFPLRGLELNLNGFLIKAVAADDSVLIFEENADGVSYSVSGCNSTASGELIIPSTYNGLPVTVIANSAFSRYTKLTSVIIPETINSIGSYAFSYCKSLISITIPGSVEKIDKYALYSCDNLKEVIISEGVTIIGSNAFGSCTNLESVKIPDTVTTIDDLAFTYCESLATITVPKGVTNISATAFNSCPSLSSINVDVNNTVYSSENGVLYNKDKTTIYKYPEGKTDSVFEIPSSVTTVGEYAFNNCVNLTSVTIPKTVSQIQRYAFYGCKNVNSLDIPNNITTIEPYSFAECRNLTKIEIPYGVTLICNGAFEYCMKLASVTIPDTVTIIGYSAFNNCQSIVEIVIPNGVTQISSNAFNGCLMLSSVVIPNTVESMGYSVFSGCKNLQSITLPISLKSIGFSAFSRCTSLESIFIPANLTDIGIDSFFACTALTAINVDSNNAKYASVDGVLFNKNKSYLYKFPTGKVMSEYVIPEGVKKIARYSFHETSLDSVIFPSTLNSIESDAFYNSKITTITIPDTVLSVYDSAFRSCSYLENIVICGTQTELYYDCFDGCPNLLVICPHHSFSYSYIYDTITPYVAYKEGVNFDLKTKFVTIDSPKEKLYDVCQSYAEGVSISMNTSSVCTGSVMSIYHYKSLHAQFTLVVNGDVNGDSVCDALDCFEVERAVSSNAELSGAYAMAADSNSDNNIDINDYQLVVNNSLSL